MVASPGASMPAPFAIPPTIQSGPGTTAVLVYRVRRLDRDGRLHAPLGRQSLGGSVNSRRDLVHRGRDADESGGKIAIWSGPTPTARAVCSAITRVSSAPAGPVHALAPPELRTTPDIRPSASTRRDQRTEAAWTRLEVNARAAARDGPVPPPGQVGITGFP